MAAMGRCITMPSGMPKEHSEVEMPYFFSQVVMLLAKDAAEDAIDADAFNAYLMLHIGKNMAYRLADRLRDAFPETQVTLLQQRRTIQHI